MSAAASAAVPTAAVRKGSGSRMAPVVVIISAIAAVTMYSFMAGSASFSLVSTSRGTPAGNTGRDKPPEPPKPCISNYPNITSIGNCTFAKCPPGRPKVYVLTSYRNRGAAYNRWLQSLHRDVVSPKTAVNPACVCSAVADYHEQPFGPTVEAALEDWPFDQHVLKVSGHFSRAGGFQVLMDNVVRTPASESLMFFMDADMIAFPGLLDRVMNKTTPGRFAFAPVCWNQARPLEGVDFHAGDWRFVGTGMMSFYYSDFLEAGGCIGMAERTSYGKEDGDFAMYMNTKSSAHVHRECAPELWHLWHKKKPWGNSVDGMSRTKYEGKNPWNSEEPWKLELPPVDTAELIKPKIGNRCKYILKHLYT